MAALQEMSATQPVSQMFSRDSTSPPASVSFGLPESSQPVHLQSGRHGGDVTVVTVVVAVGIVVGRVVVCGGVGGRIWKLENSGSGIRLPEFPTQFTAF